MKRIIDGKIYNTKTAELIHDWDNGFYGGDFKRCEEGLYRTKKGVYFLAGSGGPMSKYARPVGNMTGGGDGIKPISEADARQWLEDHDGADALEQHFADKLTEA